MGITTPTGRKIDVYFDENASPSATPVSVHQPSDAGDDVSDSRARTTQYSPSAVAASKGASGVARMSPAAANGSALMTIAACSAAPTPPRRRAMAMVAIAATQ